jgi:hypothetical protein
MSQNIENLKNNLVQDQDSEIVSSSRSEQKSWKKPLHLSGASK